MAWPEVALGEIVSEARSGFASGDDLDNGVFQFRMNNLRTDGELDLAKRRRVRPDTRDIERYLLAPGDVLFNATNSPELVGKSTFIRELDEPAVFSNHFIRLRLLRDRADPSFVTGWLQLQWARGLFRSRAKQWVNQASVGREALLRLSVPLPPLAEQQRIVVMLDAADRLRAKRRQSLALFDALIESIFLDLFGDPVTNPHKWDASIALGAVSEIVSGITKGRKLRGQVTRTVPYLAVINVQDGFLRMDIVKTIDATEAEAARYRLQKCDLLLTEGGDPDKLGRGTLWYGELPECIHQNHVFRVRIQDGRFVPEFVSRLLASERGRRYFLRSAKQTTGIASITSPSFQRFRSYALPASSRIASWKQRKPSAGPRAERASTAVNSSRS